MILETRNPLDLIPYERNAKKHPPDQVRKIANSIKQFGWDQPIVIDKDNVVIKGHGRLAAAILLDLHEVPVWPRYDLNEAQVRAARIADNQVVSHDIDEELLRAELRELLVKTEETLETFELSDLGFDEDEIDLEALSLDDDAEQQETERSSQGASEEVSDTPTDNTSDAKSKEEPEYTHLHQVIVECADETDQEKVFQMMSEQGYQCKVLSL